MFKHLLQGTSWSIIAGVVSRSSNVLLFVLISRFLGSRAAGIYTLAFSYSLITTHLTFWGLDQLLIRETAKVPASQNKLFTNFLFLRIILASLAWGILYGITNLSLSQTAPETRQIVLLVGITVFPDNIINLCEAVFVANHRVALLPWTRSLTTVVRLVGTLVLLLRGHDLIALAGIILAGSFISMGINIGIVLRQHVNLEWKLDWKFCLIQLRIAWPLILSGVFYILDNRLEILVLSLTMSEIDIAIYNSAATIVSTFLILPQAYQVVVFPEMARLHMISQIKLHQLYAYSLKYMLLLGLPLAINLIFMADFVVQLFGREFGDAARVLQIIAWVLPLLFINVPTARLLVAIDQQSIVARTLMVRLLIATILNLTLANVYGYIGSAMAYLGATLFMVGVNLFIVNRTIKYIHIFGIFGRQIVAGVGMILVALLFQEVHPWSVLLGNIVYLGLLYFSGGFSMREKDWMKRVILWFKDN
jgi:O-antigen/teichoic acid export membrane protein